MKAMDRKRISELRLKAQHVTATAFVGREGLTEMTITEVSRQLDKRKLVKVKMPHSDARDRMELARELADRTRSTMVEVRGKTVVLAKE